MSITQTVEWTFEEPPEWTVGERFRKAREFRGVKSAADMGQLLSAYFGRPISGPVVNAWERMTNQPTRGGIRFMDLVRAYSDILKIREDYFLIRSRCRALLLPPVPGQLALPGIITPTLLALAS